MSKPIKAYISSANRAFRTLHLQRCPRCLLSDAIAVHHYSDNKVVCQSCDHEFSGHHIQIVSVRANW